MIMISVNNSAGSSGLRMNSRDRENKENQMDFLGAACQGKKKKEARNAEKYWTAEAVSWDARHRSTMFLLGPGQSSVQTVKLL